MQWQLPDNRGFMEPTPQLVERCTSDAMSANELAALVENARALQRAANAGATQRLLRGKRYGLLCDAGVDGEDAALFERAAIELGAQVAHIRPGLTERSAARDVQQTAQMLGRLYDAVFCVDTAPAVVRQLTLDAGVPVYDGITSPDHLIAKAADLLGPATSRADNRRFALQALLLKVAA